MVQGGASESPTLIVVSQSLSVWGREVGGREVKGRGKGRREGRMKEREEGTRGGGREGGTMTLITKLSDLHGCKLGSEYHCNNAF